MDPVENNPAQSGTSDANTTAAPEAGGATTAKEENNILMAALSYVSILVIVPYLTAKDDPFVKFHIRQGLVLLVIEVAVYVLSMLMWMLLPLFGILNLLTIILSVIGIVNVIQKKEKELPLVGSFAHKINI